jgi:uncharacterized membrane protein
MGAQIGKEISYCQMVIYLLLLLWAKYLFDRKLEREGTTQSMVNTHYIPLSILFLNCIVQLKMNVQSKGVESRAPAQWMLSTAEIGPSVEPFTAGMVHLMILKGDMTS